MGLGGGMTVVSYRRRVLILLRTVSLSITVTFAHYYY